MEAARRRLTATAAEAKIAEAAGDEWAANEAWSRYRLIADTLRAPSELLAEEIALSQFAVKLAGLADGARRPR